MFFFSFTGYCVFYDVISPTTASSSSSSSNFSYIFCSVPLLCVRTLCVLYMDGYGIGRTKMEKERKKQQQQYIGITCKHFLRRYINESRLQKKIFRRKWTTPACRYKRTRRNVKIPKQIIYSCNVYVQAQNFRIFLKNSTFILLIIKFIGKQTGLHFAGNKNRKKKTKQYKSRISLCQKIVNCDK